jgi:hypothetical protein
MASRLTIARPAASTLWTSSAATSPLSYLQTLVKNTTRVRLTPTGRQQTAVGPGLFAEPEARASSDRDWLTADRHNRNWKSFSRIHPQNSTMQK